MKKQFKALTLALALLTTTACVSNEAKVTQAEETKAGQTQVVETKERKVANVATPKADAVKIEKKITETT
ncbi:hypothetical protein [uncultured Anaerococcus sp.]|uniref:hypothetical protein n=1 Tax=uncultured Anaerococcus sp. TaxID=293428 RepID=UPI0025EC2514|nr:hypothetical protein [uncultured Anaerococcus sp.]